MLVFLSDTAVTRLRIQRTHSCHRTSAGRAFPPHRPCPINHISTMPIDSRYNNSLQTRRTSESRQTARFSALLSTVVTCMFVLYCMQCTGYTRIKYCRVQHVCQILRCSFFYSKPPSKSRQIHIKLTLKPAHATKK